MISINSMKIKDFFSGIVLKIVRIRILRIFPRNLLFKVKPEKRISLAKQYLKGYGIEIGALHSPIILPKGAHVRYVDRMTVNELQQQYPELKIYPLVDIDIIDDGERLEKIKSESQDFVIANHFLEHTENPIGTIEAFLRVLKGGGGVYCIWQSLISDLLLISTVLSPNLNIS